MREAILLAGGYGTRMRSLTDGPKCMMFLEGKPFLQWLFDRLSKNGFQRIILSLHYKAEIIHDFFGDSYSGMQLVYDIQEKPLGTGGSVFAAMKKCRQENVYVLNADTTLAIDFDYLESVWLENGCKSLMVLANVANRDRYGGVVISNNRISEFCEKGKIGPGLINGGVYLLSRTLFSSFFSEMAEFSIETDFFRAKLKEIEIIPFVSHGTFLDMGVPEDFVVLSENTHLLAI